MRKYTFKLLLGAVFFIVLLVSLFSPDLTKMSTSEPSSLADHAAAPTSARSWPLRSQFVPLVRYLDSISELIATAVSEPGAVATGS